MTNRTEKAISTSGAGFLVSDVDPADVYTPEDITPEQAMIAGSAESFLEQKVTPKLDQIESLDYELTRDLMREAGDLGLLGAEMPEAHGGLDLDKISAAMITEKLSPAGGFGITVADHTGIGSLPIVLFGNEDQKSRYLPQMATGEKIGAYALTEPEAGSDALSARTTAVLNDDETHYILNGQKQFITNAGFADVFITYAQVNGDQFSAFIIDHDTDGLTIGPELDKMGLKGSSTCAVSLDNVAVPRENLLGEVGRGHIIALNILNIGRYKLGAGSLGGAKQALHLAASYASGRKQFDQPLSRFPLIRRKLAEMAVKTFALESVVYRTGGLLDAALGDLDDEVQNDGNATADAIAEYATEASINKVFGSEVLDFVVDEGVQIHGGYGYIQDYEIERAYRDSRINRIFEGTNEINRLLIPQTVLRRAMKGQLPLLQAAGQVAEEIKAAQPLDARNEPLDVESWFVQAAKNLFLMVGGLAVQTYGEALENEQEVVANLADMVINIYAVESAQCRTSKALANGSPARLKQLMTQVLADEAARELKRLAAETLGYIHTGSELQQELAAVEKLTSLPPLNRIETLRTIAASIVEHEGYVVKANHR